MPKMIENLRNLLLQRTKEILLEEGCDKVTLRRIASDCGVAVGTVYNYFSSKDILIASVMVEDWMERLQEAKESAARCADPIDALACVDGAIRGFSARFSTAWQAYSPGNGNVSYVRQRHRQLVDQLCEIIRPALEAFGCLYTEALPEFLAESLLSAANSDTLTFDSLRPVLEHLLERN